MITFTSGNMFDTPADIRINTVNCVGVMGAGLALAFKTKYPDMFRDYQKACKEGKVRPGHLHVWNKLFGDCIINFPTKRHWREPSRYEDIEAGLIALRKYLADKGKVKVLLPAVGCGHGGLEWNRISEMIKKQLADVESEIIVFTPEDSRTAGNKIKDHEDTQIQDRLDAEGIKVIEPGHDLYPEPLRGRTAAKLYIKGNPEKLSAPLLTILPSPKPTQQEIDAAATTVETIMRSGITLLIGYGASIERPAIKKALEKGADVIVILSEGILDFRVRKDLLDVWDDNRIVVISATKPLERWSPSTAFRAKDLQLSLASAAIITDAEPQSMSKMLIQKASQNPPFIYHIDYGKRDTNIINTFQTIKSQRISGNDLSDPKQYEAIINTLSVNELTQPIAEIHTETISAPIAENHETNEYDARGVGGSAVHETGVTGYPKRLIEVDLPIKRISEHARNEKNLRSGHPWHLHIWWARRPWGACRAVTLASLLPAPSDPDCPQAFIMKATDILHSLGYKPKTADPNDLQSTLLRFVGDFAEWELGASESYRSTAINLIKAAYPLNLPVVLDTFAGNGAIPGEAVRLGCESIALDLNPVANLVLKTLLESIPRQGYPLLEKFREGADFIKKEAEKRLARYYPKKEGKTPIACLWARTVTCEGPGCGAVIPLISQTTIAGGARKAWIEIAGHKDKTIDIHIGKGKTPPKDLIKTAGGGAAVCPVCGFTTQKASVKRQGKAHQIGHRLFGIAIPIGERQGKNYFDANDEDRKAVAAASRDWKELVKQGKATEMIEPFVLTYGLHVPPHYGISTWGDLFSDRQKIALYTLTDILQGYARHLKDEVNDASFVKDVMTALALGISNSVHYWTTMSTWLSEGMISCFITGNAIAMRWDYAEANPLTPQYAGGLEFAFKKAEESLTASIHLGKKSATVLQGNATDVPLPDDGADLFFTDPPYYDVVPYADLSDLCYVWLKRFVGTYHPDLFKTELTPKADQIVVNPYGPEDGRGEQTPAAYQERMTVAFREGRRILRPDGVGAIVFAHKGTAAWEAMLSAIIDAGFIVTASWPIDTERASRMRANKSAALGSSVHIVVRPRENEDGTLRTDNIGDWRDVLAELPKRIHEWMPRLAEEGVVGADAIFACLGPALEIYSRYPRVEKASGEMVLLREYLENVWAAVAREALNMIFAGADTSGFEEDARLTAMWLWTLSTGAANGYTSSSDTAEDEDDGEKSPKVKLSGYMLEYDAARKIAQGLGAHLEHLQSLVEVKGDKARLLSVAERSKSLFGKDESETPAARRKKKSAQLELGFIEEIEKAEQEGSWGQKNVPQLGNTRLDRLHQSMILFAAGRGEALKRFLVEEGVGQDQKFWRLAQALSALYPSSSDEKRWVDGVLARKKGFGF
jgi:adenine-specific DNA methylase/O-acetyl-ADP-ribose deacetylase (regulator of RNase III)